MFTGLIESVQSVCSITDTSCGKQIAISLEELAADIRPGDSIAVNGVCLTVSSLSGKIACFDVIHETLSVSTLGQLVEGHRINLERAMPADGRFGGHLIQGHIDGTAAVKSIEKKAGQHVIRIIANSELMKLMIPRGSVAVDGVSLTVVDIDEDSFSYSLIPTTLERTNLTDLVPENRVNIEADLIGKWINHRLDQVIPHGKKPSITLEKLQNQGFIE